MSECRECGTTVPTPSCPNCGSDNLSDDLTYCHKCTKPQDKPYCPACRAKAQTEYSSWLTEVWSGSVWERRPKDPRFAAQKHGGIHPGRRSRGATIGTIDKHHPGLIDRVKPFITNKIQSLALVGPVGIGKSWAAWGTVFGWMVRNFDNSRGAGKAAFLRWSPLMLQASGVEAFGSAGRDKAISLAELHTAPLLFIDEFGTSKPRDNQQHIVQELIDVRHEEMLATIITSTQSLEDLTANVGSAIISRFSVGDGIILLNGPDLRKIYPQVDD